MALNQCHEGVVGTNSFSPGANQSKTWHEPLPKPLNHLLVYRICQANPPSSHNLPGPFCCCTWRVFSAPAPLFFGPSLPLTYNSPRFRAEGFSQDFQRKGRVVRYPSVFDSSHSGTTQRQPTRTRFSVRGSLATITSGWDTSIATVAPRGP